MAKIAFSTKKESSVKSSGHAGPDEKQEIERLAYQFFVERGCQHGHDKEDWAKAESIVKARRS